MKMRRKQKLSSYMEIGLKLANHYLQTRRRIRKLIEQLQEQIEQSND